jgi:hypothetical protein
MDQAPLGRDCEIEAVGKQRNGKPRFWCRAHQASATGKYGRRLERCEGAYKAATQGDATELDPSAYPGGIAVWGAVKPVYDTTNLPAEVGVHVHARRVANGEKQIDGTFHCVALRVKRNLLDAPKALITLETAVASYVSRFLNRPMKSLFCTYCGDPHLDSEWFAVKLHKRHLCHSCGQVFMAKEKCVSNPLENLRHMLGDRTITELLNPLLKCWNFARRTPLVDYNSGRRIQHFFGPRQSPKKRASTFMLTRATAARASMMILLAR